MANYDMKALKGNAQAKNLLEKSMEAVTGTDKIVEIPIDKILPNPFNADIPMDDIDDLAQSIKENGLLHEITVYDMSNGTYQILSGHRRLEALKKNGATAIPCRVRPYENDEYKRFQQHFDANAQTRDKDVRFKIAEFNHAMSFYKNSDMTEDEKMDHVSALLSKNRTGYSKAQLYRLKAVTTLDPSVLTLDKYGISVYSMSRAAKLSKEAQKELVERAKELYLQKQMKSEDQPDTALQEQNITRNEFASLILQVSKDIDNKQADTPKPIPRSFQTRLREAQGKYLGWFDKVKTPEDKDIALTEIDAFEKELEEKKKILNDMTF